MAKCELLSADSHIVEPPDLWESRIDPRYRERAPRMTTDDEGVARWYVDRDTPLGSVGAPSQAGQRYEDPEAITFEGHIEDVRPGAFDPHARIEDMEVDGVNGEVIYPTIGARLYTILEGDLLSACFKASNDWMADFCKTNPRIFKGNALINLDDIQEGTQELERCASLGLAGAMISTYPSEEKRYDDPAYDPFWAIVQDLGIPLSMHVASNRPGPGQISVFTTGGQEPGSASFSVTQDYWVRRSIASMIFAGVLERYPLLMVSIVEHELAWAPYFLRTMDWHYKELSQIVPHRFKNDMLPSDFFHRNVRMTFQEDDIGILLRSHIGVDSIMWGSDYPHAESTWPNSRKVLDKVLKGVSEEERRKIVCHNVAELFGFN
ncbi:MAG: amidohydrolase family protein [Dehalococcoidia bacterium]